MMEHTNTGSMAAALRTKLSSLPPLSMDSKHMPSQHRRHPSDISSASSAYSDKSFATHYSDETQATDLTITPFPRSRASTIKSTYVPCKPPLRIILGTASVGSSLSPLAKITTTEAADTFVQSFRARGYADIDTARAYPVGRGGTCEKLLGEDALRLSKWANVSTKVTSFMPGSHKAKNIATSIDRSLEALRVESVDVMYLHAPDRSTPFLETCTAMNKAYLEGKFERFGLSNYSVAEVESIMEICTTHNLVKPTVYQGQYNPICRGAEADLLSVLRAHNIAFYAYSPSACGFFSNKVSRASKNDKSSRWNIQSPLGAKYTGDYFHDPLFAAAEIVKMHARRHGITGHAAALRWTTYHSQLAADLGDALIIGASTQAQLDENLSILEAGPLDAKLVEVLDGIWEDVRAWEAKGEKKIGPRFAMI